jgi:hypothetical protein
MTVDKLKNALTQNKIVYSTAKKKADFVDLYISNGLHNKEAVEVKEDLVEAVKAESSNEVEAVASSNEVEDLIMSITIMGHGCEDLMSPWPEQLPISTYFKNNVRVYSKACVPDVNAIGNIYQNEHLLLLKHMQTK